MAENDSQVSQTIELIAKLFLGAMFVAIIGFTVWKWPEIWAIVSPKATPEESQRVIKAWLDGLGGWAPLVFILFQFLQVVIFFIPGEVPQIAGGYFFGVGLGTLYSVIGIALGSSFTFGLARLLGIGFVSKIFGKEQIAKFEGFISSPRAKVAFFLLYLIPGLPKDILGYVAGISYLRFWTFMAISMVARLPSLIGSSLIGSAAASNDFVLLWIIVGIAVSLFLLGVIFRGRIHGWIESIMHRNKP